jgi:hypothetical protein
MNQHGNHLATVTPATATPAGTDAGAGRHPPGASVYRELVGRGFDPGEAGNLAAYLSGIAICTQPWSSREVNGLLFLRVLNRAGRFGRDDGRGSARAA